MTDRPLLGGYRSTTTAHTLAFGHDARSFVRLRGEHDLVFRLLHAYTVTAEADGWEAHTTGYAYELSLAQDREIIAYHYDPTGHSPVTTPHMHIKGATSPIYLGKAHLPTGPVSLEAVLRFAIEELGVQPLRPDWRAILDETEREFGRQRTW